MHTYAPVHACTCGFDLVEVEWFGEHEHPASCFAERFTEKEWELRKDYGKSLSDLPKYLRKWCEDNGRVGAAIYSELLDLCLCDCGIDKAHDEWAKENTHEPDCRAWRPNFLCGDLAIRWPKHIGGGMTVSREVPRAELECIFDKCQDSVK